MCVNNRIQQLFYIFKFLYYISRQFEEKNQKTLRDFETDEVRSALENAISTLTPTLRSVFVLRELEGMSTEETAVSLAVSTDVVKTRLRRARLQLREELSAYFAEKEQTV